MGDKPLARSVRPEFKEDVKALPSHELRVRVVQIIVDVSAGTLVGRPLEDHPSVGDLSDCRKVYLDEPGYPGTPRFRLVYRLLPNEVEAVTVEAIAVGRRAAMSAYVEAARRLGRFVDEAPEPGHG